MRPSVYSLTGELMAWAADRLVAGPVGTPGLVSPVEAFGLDALRWGCAEVGLVLA